MAQTPTDIAKLVDQLREAKSFRRIDASVWGDLTLRLERILLSPGEVLFRQDDPGKGIRAAQAAEALAETLLKILGNRALPLPDADRQRILECHDPNELQRWLRRAFKVDTIDELWDAA
ncbi:MAG: hypothetical protein GY856_32500 [bacterium]|nr:hypothetical protein [bacterium]